ncbi:hypothetical protein F5X99DRAFT_430360 [Biscogniauxia marginata]|nr:hypothetical protein F5X99DRAFT_430360 [Biscogniauxia marginata]
MITTPSRAYLQVPPVPAPGMYNPSTAQGTTTPAGPRVSAPYGHACSNCAKAKCKCISRGGFGNSCERCVRLGRECRPSNGVRKRAATRRPPGTTTATGASTASRTAQLEEKLDDLVSILRAQAGGGGGDAGPARIIADQIGIDDARAVAAAAAVAAATGGGSSVVLSPDPNAGGGANNSYSGGSGGSRPLGNGHGHVLTPADSHGYGTSTAGSTPVASSSSPETPLSTAQAEETLQLFREHHLKTFPAAQLASERPYLWLNIRAICSKSPSQRSALGLRCREITAKKVLVDMERNIDLLIGVLAYLGWAMHQFFGKPQLVAMMNIAITLVTDLRLDRPTQDNPSKEENCFKSYVYPKVSLSVVRTNEERRATIACYAFCSNVSMFLKSQSMRWTPHMEDSLRKLAMNPECPGDELLVTIVKAHRIIEDVAQVTWRSIDQDGMNGLSPSSRPPPMLYVKSLRQNLQVIKDDLPESLVGDKIAMSYLYATEMIICDMPFWNNNPWISAPPRRNSGGGNGGSSSGHRTTISLSRLEAYHATLQASRACMDNFLGLAPAAYVGLSFPLVMHFFRSTQILYRLLLTEDPDWGDRAAVAAELDLMAAIERGAARFARVAAAYGFESENAGANVVSSVATAAGAGTGAGGSAGKGNGRVDDNDNEGNDPIFVGYTHLDFYTKCARTLRSTIPVWNAALAQIGLGRSYSSSSSGSGSKSIRSGSGDGGNGSASITAAMDANVNGIGGAVAGSSVTGMGAGDAAMEHQLATGPPAGSSVGFAEFMPAAMDFMDDSWWTDILGSWET